MKIRLTTTVEIIDELGATLDTRTTTKSTEAGGNPRFLSASYRLTAIKATEDQDRYVRMVAESLGAISHADER